MFGPGLQQKARRFAETVVRPFAALGLTPNMATLLGLVLNSAVAVVIALGALRLGGVLLIVAGAFDMVDGALARVRNQKTTFGAFFDSTLDRYSEGIVLLGVIVFALTRLPASAQSTWLVALTYVAGLSSLMVSYTRARAEGLGLECKSGLMARPERVLLLALGLIIGGALGLLWTIAILAVTSTFTSVQRIVVVWRTIPRAHPAAAPRVTAQRVDAAQAEDTAAGDDNPRDQPLAQQELSAGYRPRHPDPASH